MVACPVCLPGRLLVALLALVWVLVAVPAPVAEAADPRPGPEVVERLEWLINNARQGRGLAPLQVHADMRDGSTVWSDRMAWRGWLYHDPGLEQKMPPEARVWGETVGRTTADDAAYAIRNAWFASDTHRRVLLDPRVTRVGVGVGSSGGHVYATARFWG